MQFKSIIITTLFGTLMACGGYEMPEEATSTSESAAKPSKAVCGDGVCQESEGYDVCEADCPWSGCGNGVCEDELVDNGDGTWSVHENCATCGPDCGKCPKEKGEGGPRR